MIATLMTFESLFMILACLIILKGFIGVLEGSRYLDYVRRHLVRLPSPWMPPASVIIPCKGLDHELAENIKAVCKQVYPFFEVLLVTAAEDDPSRPLLKTMLESFPGHRIKILTAGISEERGEKVNNLIQAITLADPSSEVFVFADADSRPHLNWLQALIAPLQDARIGLSTGYRWYFPERGNTAGVFRSAWNASVATLLGDHARNFAWGGSMAIRRSTFERAKVLRYWSDSLSDDYSMTQAMRDSKLRIHYEPRCLVGSFGKCSWRELLEWSTRQIIITHFYSQKLWRLAFFSQSSFIVVWWVSLWISIESLSRIGGGGTNSAAQAKMAFSRYGSIVVLIFILGIARGWLRTKTIQEIFPDQRQEIRRFWWGYTLLFPLVSTLTGYNLLVSAFVTSLEWRGIRYEFQSGGKLKVTRSG